MVFQSKNLFRKCKWCDKERKKNLTSGRHKGYYTTCGSKECLAMQYKDHHICVSKGKLNNPIDFICVICQKEFKQESNNHKRYCKICVPDKSWRCRAARYGIGKPQWDHLSEKQNNKCVLCDKFPEVVDHCHKQGKVRGLLCNACNTTINILDRDKDYLIKAIKYVYANDPAVAKEFQSHTPKGAKLPKKVSKKGKK